MGTYVHGVMVGEGYKACFRELLVHQALCDFTLDLHCCCYLALVHVHLSTISSVLHPVVDVHILEKEECLLASQHLSILITAT